MHLGPMLRAMLRNKVRFGLLALEVALTLAIVANCVSLILDARYELTRPSGFADNELMMVTATPFHEAFREATYRDRIIDADIAALRTLPGVLGASNTQFLPWQGGGSSTQFRRSPQSERVRTQIYPADEHLIDTLGLRLVEGRPLNRDDVLRVTQTLRQLGATTRERDDDGRATEAITMPVIVTRALARLVFPEGSALGKTFEDEDGDRNQVVGVVEHFYNPYAWKIGEYATFYPSRQGSYEGGTSYLVRAAPGQLDAVHAAVEGALTAANPNRTYRLRTIPDVKRRFLGGQTLMVRLLSLVIVVLVFITALGIVPARAGRPPRGHPAPLPPGELDHHHARHRAGRRARGRVEPHPAPAGGWRARHPGAACGGRRPALGRGLPRDALACVAGRARDPRSGDPEHLSPAGVL